MTTIQQLRATLETALDAIGPALSCWTDYMPVGNDGVRLTRLGLEKSHTDLREALTLLDRLEVEQDDHLDVIFASKEQDAIYISEKTGFVYMHASMLQQHFAQQPKDDPKDH